MPTITYASLRSVVREVSIGAAWFPIIVFTIHVVVAKGFDAYRWFPPLDIPMHVIGGVAIAYFVWCTVAVAERHNVITTIDDALRIVLVLALVTTATVFWEFAEWISDHTIGTHAQGGLDDTLFDMLCGIIGGGVYALLRVFRTKGN